MVSECELLEISRTRSWGIHRSFSGEALRILWARKAKMLMKGTKLVWSTAIMHTDSEVSR